MIAEIEDLRDARLADYRDLRDRPHRADGTFIAESEVVVRKLLGSALHIRSLLLTPPRLAALRDALPSDLPVYVVPQALMDRVAGFHVHRGCLAIGERPADAPVPAGARVVLAAEDLTDVDNLGALARNGAALGADALLLSPRCADPYYRKAIRVSAGHVFLLPIVRAADFHAELRALRARGFSLLAAVTDPDATPVARMTPPEKYVVVLGAEGPGLAPATRALADVRITVPLARGDSLNVAVAAAVVLAGLRREATSPTGA